MQNGEIKMENQESIGRLISYIHRHSQIHIAKELGTYNIGSGQFSFLMILYHNDGVSQESIAKALRVDKATTARAIKKLMEEEYVYKERSPLDKRVYKVFLTERAKKIKSKIIRVLSGWTEFLLSDFTKEERELFTKLLIKIAKNASSIKQD